MVVVFKSGLGKLCPVGQIWPASCLCKYSSWKTASHSFVYVLSIAALKEKLISMCSLYFYMIDILTTL